MSKRRKSVKQEFVDEFELMLELARIQDLLRVIILINLDPTQETRLKKIKKILKEDDRTTQMVEWIVQRTLIDAFE